MFHQIKDYLSAPCTIDHVGIWSKTLNGKQFIFHNSKHSIFGTFESLKTIDSERLNHVQIHSINSIQ